MTMVPVEVPGVEHRPRSRWTSAPYDAVSADADEAEPPAMNPIPARDGGPPVQSGPSSRAMVGCPLSREPEDQGRGAARQSSVAPCPRDGVRLQILLIEEEQDFRTIVAGMLTRLGCDVTPCATYGAAVGALDGNEFDLLISDFRIPGGDAFELLRRARSRFPAIEIIIEYVVPPSGREEEVRALKPRAMLAKPLRLSHLMEAVLKCVSPS